ASGAPQEIARLREVPQLGHRGPAQRQRRWIASQRDPLQGAQRVPRAQGTGRRGDGGIHRSIVTPSPLLLPPLPAPQLFPRAVRTGHKEPTMNLARSKDEWLAARKALLAREKDLTRMRDAVSAERRALPWMKVEKPYLFDTPRGRRTLADLFDGRSQLAIYHF